MGQKLLITSTSQKAIKIGTYKLLCWPSILASLVKFGLAATPWDRLGIILSQKVQEVASDIFIKHPGRRAKLGQVFEFIPELKAKLGRLERLDPYGSHKVLG